MGYGTVFAEVMKEYERDRDLQREALRRRKAEVYREIPQIEQIDNQIRQTGVMIVKVAAGDEAYSLADLQQKHLMLVAQKTDMLAKSQFGAGYLDERFKCDVCKDTGFIDAHETNGVSVRCACLRQRLISRYYDLSNLKNILETDNFDTFDIRYYSEAKLQEQGDISPRDAIMNIYRICTSFVNDFDIRFENLFIQGETGLGKTFMCSCIAKDLLDRGKTVLYVTAPKLFKTIEGIRFNRDEMDEPDETENALTEVDLLVIDDLGTEVDTMVTSAELFHIINTRLISKKHTIISTNLSLAEFQRDYSIRVTSRLLGDYRKLHFIGDDIRLKKKYGIIYGG